MAALVLETRPQPNKTTNVGRIALGPTVCEDYWLYRVKLTDTQAILGFPKYSTVGIGFALEEDWNSDLPYTCAAEKIYEHIKHNKGSDRIRDEDCLAAIRLIQQAAARDRPIQRGR